MGEIGVFHLFNSEYLKILLSDEGQYKGILDDFSRFLAAYFLNFSPFWRKYENIRLPNLFEWSDYEEEDIDLNRYIPISRRKVSGKLPPEFSPKFSILLLFRLGHYLEATLCADYFNDFRSSLLIRYLIDLKHGLNLFHDHCEKNLIRDFIEASDLLEDELTDLVLQRYNEPYILSILQIDLIFEKKFLYQIEEEAIQQIEFLSKKFFDEVDQNVKLPRPPIYSLPTQNASIEPEVLTWNKIHFYIQIFLTSLQRTNRLHLLISCSISKIYRLSSLAKDDLAFYLIESESNSLSIQDETNFSRFILTVLKISYRDFWNLTKRQEKIEEESILFEKYLWLKQQEDSKNFIKVFENWIQISDEFDIQYLLTFLNFLQENYPQKEKFLSPLSSESKERWKSTFLGGISMKSSYRNLDEPNLEWLWKGTEKINVEPIEFMKMKFLSENFSSLSLSDPTLIQIALKIKVEDLCVSNRKVMFSNYEYSSETISTEFLKEPTVEFTSKILESIRGSIQRLSEVEKNTYGIKQAPVLSPIPSLSQNTLKKFDSILEKFHQNELEEEIKQEQEFIRSLPIYPSTSRLTLDEEPYPRTSTPLTYPRRIKSYEEYHDRPSTSKQYEYETEPEPNLRIELAQIGEKLSEIRKYLDHTTRKLTPIEKSGKEHKTAKKSLARQRRSSRSSGSSSSGLSSASSSLTPLSLIREEDIPQKSTLKRSKAELNLHEDISKTSESEESSKSLSQKAQFEGEEESLSEALSFSMSPIRSKREQNFLQNLELLPEPSLPRLEKLDLGQLSPELKPKKEWTELNLYEPELSKRDSAYKSIEREQEKGFNIDKAPKKSEFQYPDWLKLIPLTEKPSSSRLLELKWFDLFSRTEKQYSTARQEGYRPEKSSKAEKATRYDSGFLDTTKEQSLEETQPKVHFVADMSEEQIQELIRLCRS